MAVRTGPSLAVALRYAARARRGGRKWDTSAARAVLLVEDNPADIYLIRQALAACAPHIHLSVIPNGRDALAFLRKEGAYALEPSPALILLDLNLPHLEGHQVLTGLRQLPAYQATPVVIFSAARKEQEEPSCLQLGATAYVQKPEVLEKFFAAIEAIVGEWLPEGSEEEE
jgi:two-component system, chemotaxis family, response regulator Rcp1